MTPPPAASWLATLVLALLHTTCAGGQRIEFVEGGSWSVPVVSQQAARRGSTLRQQFDFSCGAAALATLLTYHYGQPTAEQTVFDAMLRDGDVDKIRAEGFSLLDMKRYLASLGFEADGFELPLDKLVEARLPAIVLISDQGYNHFVVVKGLRADRVLIGDPVRGSRVLERRQFEQLWPGRLLFVIHNQQDLASFNTVADWHGHPTAPWASAVPRESLGAATMPRLGINEN